MTNSHKPVGRLWLNVSYVTKFFGAIARIFYSGFVWCLVFGVWCLVLILKWLIFMYNLS